MQNANGHLDPERFAAFDHESPTTDELAHLAGCASCRAERQAYLSLQALAGALRAEPVADAPRLTEWERLATGLRAEGLITSPALASAGVSGDEEPLVVRTLGGFAAPSAATMSPSFAPHVTPMTTARRGMPTWLRVAAALMLTLGGALFGRYTADSSAVSAAAFTPTVAVANTDGDDNFASVQQASEVLYRAQRDYERASLWLAANDTTVHDSDVYRARLAALDQMMAASRAALRDAPQDPVLNHYFLSAYTAREATLKALSSVLPVDKSLERY